MSLAARLDEDDAFLGPLAEAPADRLHGVELTRSVLAATELAKGCYLPIRAEEDDADIAILFAPFVWRKGAFRLWLLSTLGLSRTAQPIEEEGGLAPKSFELCCAFREPRSPNWFEFRRAWSNGHLDRMPGVPAIFSEFADIAQDFYSWMLRDGEVFTFGDPIFDCSLVDRFSSALLIPPIPELLVSGLAPFSRGESGQAVRAEIPSAEWLNKELLLDAGDFAFLQLAPLLPDEHALAEQGLGWHFFLQGLLPSDAELDAGKGASEVITNLTRASRIAAYRSALSQLGSPR